MEHVEEYIKQGSLGTGYKIRDLYRLSSAAKAIR